MVDRVAPRIAFAHLNEEVVKLPLHAFTSIRRHVAEKLDGEAPVDRRSNNSNDAIAIVAEETRVILALIDVPFCPFVFQIAHGTSDTTPGHALQAAESETMSS